jgi:hypothetical protein
MKAYQQGQVRFVLWGDGGFTVFWEEARQLRTVYDYDDEEVVAENELE